jgi:hypothetical protein
VDQGKLKSPPRRVFGIRVSVNAFVFIRDRAIQRGVKTSEEARIMLAYAALHMPPGWTPPGT